MFFRFGSALVLVVIVSLAGTMLEKRSLELRREVSRQQYRLQALKEQFAARRVQVQRWGAPLRMLESVSSAEGSTSPPRTSEARQRITPPTLPAASPTPTISQ